MLTDGDLITVGGVRMEFKLARPRRAAALFSLSMDSADTEVRASMAGPQDGAFLPERHVRDEGILRADYEKLRVALALGNLIGVEREIDVVLDRILGYCFDVLPADSGAFFRSDTGQGWTAIATRSQHGERLVVSQTVLSQVERTGEALLLGDASIDPVYVDAASLVDQGIRSVLAVPLRVGGQTRAVLVLNNRRTASAFSAKDLNLLVGIAGQASISVEKAELALLVSLTFPVPGAHRRGPGRRRIPRATRQAAGDGLVHRHPWVHGCIGAGWARRPAR